MSIMLLVLLPFAAGVTAYMYFFLKRAFSTFGADYAKKKPKLITFAAAVCIGILFINIFGFAAIVILHILMFDLILRLLNFIVRKLLERRYEKLGKTIKTIFSSGLPALLVSAIVLLFGYINMNNVVKTEYTVYTEKNIRDEGYRIAFISDIHFGVSLNLDELQEVCDSISKEKVDIVILGGDIVDNETDKEKLSSLFEALGEIENKLGTFYIYGNHDRPMSRMRSGFTSAELLAAIEGAGIKVLCDSTVELGNDLVLAGREDRGYSVKGEEMRKNISELLSEEDKKKFILTLDHQPTEYKENGEAGTDLLLSGHTHGGQIWPANIADSLFKINEANYGHVKIDAGSEAIVSSGLAGWGYPIKTSAPAEYVIVNIREKK